MALLFSKVTLTAEDKQTSFFVSGSPKSIDEFDGWKAYEKFIGNIDTECDFDVHVDVYVYGEGKVFTATPEEVAYLTMRVEADAKFLHTLCDKVGENDFTVSWSTNRISNTEML